LIRFPVATLSRPQLRRYRHPHARGDNEFGIVDLKSTSKMGTGGRPVECADLNEQQSTLILTYMRNSEIVRSPRAWVWSG
jgi:hypothetical protein